MREDFETERPGTTAGTPQFANAGAIQKFPVYSMYMREQYITHKHGRMKVHHLYDKCNVWKEGNFEHSCHTTVQRVQRYRPKNFRDESFEFKACPVHLKVPEEVNFAKP